MNATDWLLVILVALLVLGWVGRELYKGRGDWE